MYHSHQSIEEHNISIFKLLIQRTIEGFDGYKEEISAVVSEAKALLNEEKTIYDISKKSFSIILFLKKNNDGLLENINPKNIKKQEYEIMLEIFQKRQLQYSLTECMYS